MMTNPYLEQKPWFVNQPIKKGGHGLLVAFPGISAVNHQTIQETIQVPELEYLSCISCMDTAHVRKNPPKNSRK